MRTPGCHQPVDVRLRCVPYAHSPQDDWVGRGDGEDRPGSAAPGRSTTTAAALAIMTTASSPGVRLSVGGRGYLGSMTGAPEDREVRIELPQDVRAAAEARQAVLATLTRWRLVALLEEVTLVVSELVTNAVKHGMPPISLSMTRAARHVRVDVHDEAQENPSSGPVSQDAESGRGLAIVEAVTRTSGVEQIEDDGKVVYATFDAPVERPEGR